jgi:hypothetical protein
LLLGAARRDLGLGLERQCVSKKHLAVSYRDKAWRAQVRF